MEAKNALCDAQLAQVTGGTIDACNTVADQIRDLFSSYRAQNKSASEFYEAAHGIIAQAQQNKVPLDSSDLSYLFQLIDISCGMLNK